MVSTAEIENAVLLRHGAQASVRVLRLIQPEWGSQDKVPWYWLALKLPGERELLLGRRRTQSELLSMVESR
jgi:hypothetical protein